ncbi:MAG TPA: NPCBM/NEW2 domain-containing protein [Polyangiaceae bacterium]|nr:NPCBM/NEW2 domain-containing protein [Polyangiaceae bacterium]
MLALAGVWLHRYPLGVDLPQHANLFRLWADLYGGPFEYRTTYRVDYFTPYLVPYAVALPLTKLFGALVATKLLLSFLVIATPLAMSRWLRAIGAAPAFGLVGYVIAFDYWYIWGFMSCAVATPLMFAYLASFEAQGDAPKLKAILRTSLLAVLLFFSHGITFGVSLAVAGLSWLVRGRWFARYRAALHVVPLGVLAVFWVFLRQEQTTSQHIAEWFDKQRAIGLFSNAFTAFPDEFWAQVGAAGVLAFLLLARPKLARFPARWLPFGFALLGFVALPDWIASTWLVGSRFSVFVHAFAPALLVPRVGDVLARRWLLILSALVAAFLIVFNVRLYRFNRELDGFREIAAAIPRGADVQTLVPETNNKSEEFGASVLGQIPAWLTAENGGLIANDSAVAGYFQIPIRRNDVPLFQDYPYVIAHGNYRHLRGQLNHLTSTPRGPARLVKESGGWLLLKRPAIENADFEVVRFGQSWGSLHLDQSVLGNKLKVAGVEYASGLGTHAQSVVRIRFKRRVAAFSGSCGVDDEVGPQGHAGFRVRDSGGKVLFDSGELFENGQPHPFSVAVDGSNELVLEAYTPGHNGHAHADWLSLSAR